MAALPIQGDFTAAIEAVRGARAELAALEARQRLDKAFNALLDGMGATVAEWNAGARITDDCFCPRCGARGHVACCRPCSED